MRLKYQLFVSLLLVSAILIALMYAFNRWSFNNGFLDYLNRIELQSLSELSAALETEYQETGDWNQLLQNDDLWQDLVRDNLPTGRSRPRPQGNRRQDNNRRPVNNRTKPILADVNKDILFGPRKTPPNLIWRELKLNDTAIGYLGLAPRRELTDDIDQVFSKQQQRSFTLAALVLTAVSALLAGILSSRLVKPILKIKDSVKQIRDGDFSYRIDTGGDTGARKDELGELSSDINHLAHTLQENLKARQQWIAEISHELRTPVAVLQAELESLQDGITQPDSAAIESLHGETTRLSRLIDDLHLLSLSDIGSLDYQFSKVNVLELLNERTQAGRTLLSDKNLTLTINSANDLSKDLCSVNGDGHRLGQLFDNLLQNSVRYTHSGGEIAISISTNSGMLNIDWADSAPGVSEAQLPQLFDTLYRAEKSRSRTLGGSGLGLAIVKKIAEAHSGTVQAAHSDLGGLCITVSIPSDNG